MKRKVCAIVDSYRSGALIAEEFRRRGVEVVNVKSGHPVSVSDRKAYEEHLYVADVSPEELLERYDPICVIPSRDTGVEIADAISEKLGLITNGTRLSLARRDKFEMIKAVSAAGLKTSRQISSTILSELITWAERNDEWPIVLKPLKSHGSDNVFRCENRSEVEKAFSIIAQNMNSAGTVLAQSFLQGIECQVNTVSYKGHHHIVNFLKYEKVTKHGVSFLYHSVEYLPFQGELQSQVGPYAFKVLDALGIENGPARLEIMLTPSGPALIEMGARIAGGKASLTSRAATGFSHVEATVDVYLEPEKFLSYCGNPYEFKNFVFAEFVACPRDSIRLNQADLKAIENLPSFGWFNFGTKDKSGLFKKTVDLPSSPFHVILVGKDRDRVMQDKIRVHALEDTSLFVEGPNVCI